MKGLNFISLVIIFILISCKNNNKDAAVSTSPKYVYIQEENGNSFYVYYHTVDTAYSNVDSILVKYKGIKQTLHLMEKGIGLSTDMLNALPIDTRFDFNFDGYNDLRINSLKYNNDDRFGDNNRYFIFIFDSSKKTFQEFPQLFQLYNPFPCVSRKIIYAADFLRVIDVYYEAYLWQNDTLDKVQSIEERRIKNDTYRIKEVDLNTNKISIYYEKTSLYEIVCR